MVRFGTFYLNELIERQTPASQALALEVGSLPLSPTIREDVVLGS